MELDVLHRAVAPEIVEFYGAFFIESCVYYCMEYMDAGSMDKLQGAGVPEDVLAVTATSMVRGLKFLKDDLQIIHRGGQIAILRFHPFIRAVDVLCTPSSPFDRYQLIYSLRRCKTNQCASQQKGRNQIMRLWRVRTTGKIVSQN